MPMLVTVLLMLCGMVAGYSAMRLERRLLRMLFLLSLLGAAVVSKVVLSDAGYGMALLLGAGVGTSIQFYREQSRTKNSKK